MQTRLLLKTHYQISKPGIFSVLIDRCTSQFQSTYPGTISKRISKIKFKSISLNKESSKFVVNMAMGLMLLTKNMFWDWRGQAISVLLSETERDTPDEYLNLTEAELLLFFKYYLEGDGAVFLETSLKLIKKNSISRQELLHTDFIDTIFLTIWEKYRSLESDLRNLINLRENIKKLSQKGYTYKTRIHKALTHIETLVEFGFLERKIEGKEIVFTLKKTNGTFPIEQLCNELVDIKVMEEKFREYKLFHIISNVYNYNTVLYEQNSHFNLLIKHLKNLYLKSYTQPTRMASLSLIFDLLSVKLLIEEKILLEHKEFNLELDRIKKNNPRAIRFHMDFSGKKAYIILSDEFCHSME